MTKTQLLIVFTSFIFLSIGCKKDRKGHSEVKTQNPEIELITLFPKSINVPNGMVWIPGKQFMQGATPGDTLSMHHEKPSHPVAVDGFFIDITEVTNAQFKKFVQETGYITLAERKIEWEVMKKELPPETQRPADSILQPGSLIFKKISSDKSNLYDYSQWWEWKIGANWKHPKGSKSTIEGKDDYPVVHVAYEDALAYCKWANRRLPTEAEWELASRGEKLKTIYNWGDSDDSLSEKANTWNGVFPNTNTVEDGFEGISPVKSFPPNSLGLYDMAGNIWEWTQDWYHIYYYQQLLENGLAINPKGPEEPHNLNNSFSIEKVIKGGSFLCNKSYCASYRNSARMGNSIKSSSEHIGFRTVATINMLNSRFE